MSGCWLNLDWRLLFFADFDIRSLKEATFMIASSLKPQFKFLATFRMRTGSISSLGGNMGPPNFHMMLKGHVWWQSRQNSIVMIQDDICPQDQCCLAFQHYHLSLSKENIVTLCFVCHIVKNHLMSGKPPLVKPPNRLLGKFWMLPPPPPTWRRRRKPLIWISNHRSKSRQAPWCL